MLLGGIHGPVEIFQCDCSPRAMEIRESYVTMFLVRIDGIGGVSTLRFFVGQE